MPYLAQILGGLATPGEGSTDVSDSATFPTATQIVLGRLAWKRVMSHERWSNSSFEIGT